MAARTLKFRVEVDIDRSVSAAELQDYIQEAVRCWAKGGHPDYPLFDLTDDDVRVVQWREPKLATAKAEGRS
jgi:hypothetical protein